MSRPVDRTAAPWAQASRLGKFRLRSGRKPISTSGHLRGAEVGHVYVGVSRAGRVKVGMSASPQRRCAALGIRLFAEIPVVASVAKEVEQGALRLLGHRQHDGEWGHFTPEAAIAAVREAYALVGRAKRVDPGQTEAEARAMRVALDSGGRHVSAG
jgi:hypothetical protein